MGDEDGVVPPTPAKSMAAQKSIEAHDIDDEHERDVNETGVKFDKMVSKRLLGKMSTYSHATLAAQEQVEVDRTALEAILDVSSRIQDIQKKSKVSMSTLALAHESYKDKQVNKIID